MELPELQDIDSQKIENYRKFVNATLEIMKESGIAKTSIRKIAERAGCSITLPFTCTLKT